MKEEKPKYGWYVKNLIIGFNIIGMLGLTTFVFGLLVDEIVKLILIISGVVIMLVFLWPGIGMTIMHLQFLGRISLVAKMEALRNIENPEILDVGCGTARTRISKVSYLSKIDCLANEERRKLPRLESQVYARKNIKRWGNGAIRVTVGWSDCGCGVGFDGGVVLDPFVGSGTTCLVARKLLRGYVGVDVNPRYVEMSRRRLKSIPSRLDSF